MKVRSEFRITKGHLARLAQTALHTEVRRIQKRGTSRAMCLLTNRHGQVVKKGDGSLFEATRQCWNQGVHGCIVVAFVEVAFPGGKSCAVACCAYSRTGWSRSWLQPWQGGRSFDAAHADNSIAELIWRKGLGAGTNGGLLP